MNRTLLAVIVTLICNFTVVNAQFGPPQLINSPTDTPSSKQFIRTADIDSDGKPDIIVASSFNETCRIFHNESNFAFATATIMPGTWQRLGGMETADLNNDGKPDVVTIDTQADRLFWHPNIDGSFPQQNLIAENLDLQFTRIVCDDFNNDGNTDIVIINHFNVQLYLNDGAGNFASPQNILTPEQQSEFYDNVAGDFNNDGFKDLAIASGGFNIYLNDGTGHFTEAPGGGIAISFLLECADYNNDGLDDILMDANTLVPYLNSPTGFSVVSQFSPNNENYQTIFSSDLDNDGDLDVISEDNQTTAFFWYENVEGATSWIRHTISTGSGFSSIYGVRAADLDGDADNDLIRTSGNGEVAIYENELNLRAQQFSKINFTLYPNPASERIQISANENILAVEIYDLPGKKISSDFFNGKEISVDISSIKAGIYFLKAVGVNGAAVKQFVVEK